jgi:Fic family protein
MKNPPFTITHTILSTSMDIMQLLGELDAFRMTRPEVSLRKSNQIKTIQASLAIEGNTLSIDQVTDLMDGVPVVGPKQDVLEVTNALKLYGCFEGFKYTSISDFKKAHKILMKDLKPDAGSFRAKNVGIFAGSKVAHIAPQPKMVPKLMQDLFKFLQNKDDISLLIKSCVFHYELEFIHPFTDGNGRMGRLWQHLILSNMHDIFKYISIESLIKQRQKNYYEMLSECDKKGESTCFIEFSLELVKEALSFYAKNIKYHPKTSSDRLGFAKAKLTVKFSRKDYFVLFKNISTATASRDLKLGVDQGLLIKTGDKRLATYQFK